MKEAYEKLVNIFVEYASEEAFALMPGHSYFMEEDNAKAAQSLKTNLLPLLEEYLEQGYISSFSGPVDAYIQWINTL
jgi:5-methylcytosine-specific restriction protein B